MRINLDYLHDCSNLRRLLAENPKLPVIVYAGENANTGDYQYLCCSRVECSVGEVLDCELPFGGKEVFYDRDYFRERLADYLAERRISGTDIPITSTFTAAFTRQKKAESLSRLMQ